MVGVDCAYEEDIEGGVVGVGGCVPGRGTGFRGMCSRRKDEAGSVREGWRGVSREVRGVSWRWRGGWRESTRIGCSAARFGDVDVCVKGFWSWGRSVEAKLRVVRLSWVVVSPGVGERMIVFLHFSHTPGEDEMGCLQVLQMATVTVDADRAVCLYDVVRPKSNWGLAPPGGDMQGTRGEEFGS